MKKVLMVASVPSMIGQFNRDNLKLLLQKKYEVEVACNWKDNSFWSIEKNLEFQNELISNGVKANQVYFERSPFKIVSIIASYVQLKKLLKKNNYDFVHCHTPIAGCITRLACKKVNAKCIYTAHGFHFYKKSPLLNWVVYYPIEKLMSKYTDILITINKEDYNLAECKFKQKKLVYIAGVGVDLNKFNSDIDREMYRKKLGLSCKSKMLLSVGELSKRKNHQIVIKAISELNDKTIHYYIAGQGKEEAVLKALSEKLHVESQIHLLGFRKDILELNKSADLFVFPSLQEGLPVALMEALASKSKILCSRIRGNVDLIEDESNLFNPNNMEELKNKISNILYTTNQENINYDSKLLMIEKETIIKKMNDVYDGF